MSAKRWTSYEMDRLGMESRTQRDRLGQQTRETGAEHTARQESLNGVPNIKGVNSARET